MFKRAVDSYLISFSFDSVSSSFSIRNYCHFPIQYQQYLDPAIIQLNSKKNLRITSMTLEGNHYIDYYQDYNNEKMVSKIQILIPSASNYSIILNTNELIHEKKDIPIQVPSASKVEFSEMMDVYYNEQWHHVSVQMAPQFVMIYKANQQVSSKSFPFFPHILESSTLLLGIPLKKAQISLLNASNFSTLVFKISLYFQFNR